MNLDFLRPLYDQGGPWLSVYLDGTRFTEDGAERVAKRWRGLRESLAGQGVDAATLAAMDAAALSATTGLALFATRGRLALAVPLPDAPVRESATVDRLPRVLPLLAALGEPVPWVSVVADRNGADFTYSPGWRPPWTDTVDGTEEWPLHKVDAGGWSQSRHQRSADMSWDRNAEQVAEVVALAADEVRAEVLLVAGDVRARALIIEHLPPRWAPLAMQAEGSRAAGADPAAPQAATEEAVRAAEVRRRAVALDQFHLRGAAGLEDVAYAARQGRIGTLLLPTTGLEGRLWVGPDPAEVASDNGQEPAGTAPGEAAAPPGATLAPARADEALIRAAAGTDAALVVVDPLDLPNGVGAVLRW